MTVATVNGLEIAYEVIGDGGQTWAPDDDITAISVPAIVFRSGASDPAHPRATSEAVAGLIPGAKLLEPPWGDREWADRGEQRDASGESLFLHWSLLVPQLAAFGDELP